MDSTILPLFPLELVLYPGEVATLHIFEPRYKRLVSDCLRGDQRFGIVLLDDGEMAGVGCEAEIREVLHQYTDGRMDIAVVGRRRFRLGQVIEEKAYLQCRARVLTESDEPVNSDHLERLITQHMKLLELAGHEVRPTVYQSANPVSFFIARNAGLDLGQKQSLLEQDSENDRIDFLVGFMEEFIPRVQQIEAVRLKVKSNGHFEDYPPKEDSTPD